MSHQIVCTVFSCSLQKVVVPWVSVLTSLPFLTTIVCHFSYEWIVMVFNTIIPEYMAQILKLDIRAVSPPLLCFQKNTNFELHNTQNCMHISPNCFPCDNNCSLNSNKAWKDNYNRLQILWDPFEFRDRLPKKCIRHSNTKQQWRQAQDATGYSKSLAIFNASIFCTTTEWFICTLTISWIMVLRNGLWRMVRSSSSKRSPQYHCHKESYAIHRWVWIA